MDDDPNVRVVFKTGSRRVDLPVVDPKLPFRLVVTFSPPKSTLAARYLAQNVDTTDAAGDDVCEEHVVLGRTAEALQDFIDRKGYLHDFLVKKMEITDANGEKVYTTAR